MVDDKGTIGRTTTKLEAPPDWAVEGFTRINETIRLMKLSLEDRLATQDTKLDLCVSGLKTLTTEVERVKQEFYEHKGETLARFQAGSMRVRAITISDDEQNQVISELSKSQLTALIKEAAKTPMGQKIVLALGTVILALLGLATIQISMQVAKLQQQQAIPVHVETNTRNEAPKEEKK